jgi:5-(carboxyamino)imidazole ribonucleotide synthase
MKLGILGGGQLGMMICQAARKNNIDTIIYTDSSDSPAVHFSNNHFISDYNDLSKIDEFINQCDVITYEFENIPYETLKHINKKLKVFPSPSVNNIIQDRLTEKNFINKLDIDTVPFLEVSDKKLSKIDEDFFPAILKTRRMGYDGKGQSIINDLRSLTEIEQDTYILEKKIDLKQEISVITVRYQDESLFSYLPIDNTHKDQILFKSISPALINQDLKLKALMWSEKIIKSLDYIGVICVEFFIDKNDKLYVNEIAPRVHNSGHLTIESYNISQFESHVRAVCNLEKIEPKIQNEAEMLNILGSDIFKYRNQVINDNHFFHDYFKNEAKKGRKMGHLTKIKN